jgi:hypothetical protein
LPRGAAVRTANVDAPTIAQNLDVPTIEQNVGLQQRRNVEAPTIEPVCRRSDHEENVEPATNALLARRNLRL